MDEVEFATSRVRVYPSDYKILSGLAKKKRTSMAQIIHEMSHSGSFGKKIN